MDGRHLPGASDCVLRLHRDLRAVERRTTLVENELKALLLRRQPQRLGGLRPLLVGADALDRVAGRELEVEVLESVVAQEIEDEGEEAVELVAHLLLRAVDVGIVLGEAARSRESLDDAGLLVPIDRAELEQAHRKLAV